MTTLNFFCVETSGRRDSIIAQIYGNVTVKDCGYETPCYLWNGRSSGDNKEGKSGRGYPRWELDGLTVAVHRVVFVHFEGYISARRHVDHKCRSRMCVRYEHLESVTHKQNCKRRDQANGITRKRRKRKSANKRNRSKQSAVSPVLALSKQDHHGRTNGLAGRTGRDNVPLDQASQSG